MRDGARRLIFHPASAVYWAMEQHCTLVVNEVRREVFRLSGLEQVLWDCLDLDYTPQQVHQAISAAGKLEPDAAAREIQAILQEWHNLGLVEVEAEARG